MLVSVLLINLLAYPLRPQSRPKKYWKDIDNQRRFLTDLAADMGFDPLVLRNWRSVSRAHISQRVRRLEPQPDR